MVHQRLGAFRDGLRAHGWADAALEFRYADGGTERLPDLVGELIRLRVAVIVTTTGRAAAEARKLTTKVPIVMTSSGDAVVQGVVASLARPGGNVTGLTNSAPELTQKQLALFKEALPTMSRIAVIRCGSGAVIEQQWREVRTAAPTLGLQIQPLLVRGPDDIDRVVTAAAKERAQEAFLLSCPAVANRIADVTVAQGVAVGTPVARRPPRRSQRALLTHWAPALGPDVEALLRPRVDNPDRRKPPVDEAPRP